MIEKNTPQKSNFTHFRTPTEGIPLPENFTFPFHYQPHPLSLLAVWELQQHLAEQQDWQHDFDSEHDGLGKMFGVLVVQNVAGELGYLAAFSGKLADDNHQPGFVPPVFDVFEKDGFFRKEEAEISRINREIEGLERDENFIEIQTRLKSETERSHAEIENFKKIVAAEKIRRDQLRAEAEATLPPHELPILQEKLNRESADFFYQLKDLKRRWQRQLDALQADVDVFLKKISQLKEERKTRSSRLQQRLFEQFFFLNQAGERKNLGEIFDDQPPAGAGECAAPKLLQHAFLEGLRPVAMAEFWWGKSPVTEVRRHGQFYPACKGKCEPILSHMLAGLRLDPNPLAENPAAGKTLDILFEDEHLLVVNKPADFYSVPGKKITDSVFSRIRNLYPEATGPLIVHRLDMSTSGLMLIAKTKDVHENLQKQFLERQVKKRYVAILDGPVGPDAGEIDLPLRVDLDDRPRQLVCYEHGKPAQTRWQVVERADGRTRIHFFPITGRTHQLRVHAAHALGLNTPILGDDLYGRPAERLFLHAERLEFFHPVAEKWVVLEAKADF